MLSVLRLVNPGVWKHAADNELPVVMDERARQNPTTQQFLVVAGGIALVLSRCSTDVQRRRYPATSQLYALLKKELQKHGRTSASAHNLLDAFHEVAGELDPISKEAFHICLEARRQYDSNLRGASGATSEPGTTTGAFASRAMPLESLQISGGPESPPSSLVAKTGGQRPGTSSAPLRSGS